MCEWCGRPATGLLCARCEEADADMARAEWAAEAAEVTRQRAWQAAQERRAASLDEVMAAGLPPFQRGGVQRWREK